MDKELRFIQRFSNFKKAVLQLEDCFELGALNKFEQQGLIQCFEYTFELAWKTVKDYLELQGFDVKSPRSAIQTAFSVGLIKDGHVWIEALEKRNLLAHTYDENMAMEAEGLIRDKYCAALIELCKALEEL